MSRKNHHVDLGFDLYHIKYLGPHLEGIKLSWNHLKTATFRITHWVTFFKNYNHSQKATQQSWNFPNYKFPLTFFGIYNSEQFEIKLCEPRSDIWF